MKRSSKRGDDDVVRYFTFACVKNDPKKKSTGKNSFAPKPSTKTDCKAKIRFSLCDDGNIRVTTVHLDHDHLLSPGKARHFRCNRKIADHVKRRLEINDEAGIELSKNYHSLVVEANGYENVTFNEIDCRNHIEKVRRSKLGVGVAEAVCKYFSQMQEVDKNFFSVVDIDEESRIRNLFWADGRKKLSGYSEYEDINTFMQTVVYDARTEEEFDSGWSMMIGGYNLHDNEWLQGLYTDRERFVNHKTTLKQFVALYEQALKRKVEKENMADYESWNSRFHCLRNYDIEKQFQIENSVYEYNVEEDVKVDDIRKDVTFTFRGILCRHIMSVLIARRINEVHPRYILHRWRKDLKRRYTLVRIGYNPLSQQIQRCEKICTAFHEVAVIAMDDEEKYEFGDEMHSRIKVKITSGELNKKETTRAFSSQPQNYVEQRKVLGGANTVLSLVVTRGKGRPATKRKILRLEVVVQKLKKRNQNKKLKETATKNLKCTKAPMKTLEADNICDPTAFKATFNNLEVNQVPSFERYYMPRPPDLCIYSHSAQLQEKGTTSHGHPLHPFILKVVRFNFKKM
ncbi:FAR1-related protein [Striga asiatica]|uniref:FAR1-related protein n=1 Tax=Striga asiatica TaxID=4170 RepID=A0A5A7QY09_STRAF|nr:FAR1-related protein [Striga asiatica]